MVEVVNALGVGDSNIWDMDGVLVAQGEPFTEMPGFGGIPTGKSSWKSIG